MENAKKIINFAENNFDDGNYNSNNAVTQSRNLSKLTKFIRDYKLRINHFDIDVYLFIISKSPKISQMVGAILSLNDYVSYMRSEFFEGLASAYASMHGFDLKYERDEVEDTDENGYALHKNSYDIDCTGQYLRAIGTIPLYTTAEEVEAFTRYKNTTGEEQERVMQEIMEHNLRLVISIVKKKTTDQRLFDDLVQEGNIGLMKAIYKFDLSKGCKFSTYAVWWIRQSIDRFIADFDRTVRIPVHLFEEINKMKRTEIKMAAELFRDPTSDELAEELGTTRDRIIDLKTNALDIVSLDQPIRAEDGTEESLLGDFIVEEKYNSNYNDLFSERKELREIVENAPMKDKERFVIKCRFGFLDGSFHTLEEIAQKLHVTRERIRQIEAKGLYKLRQYSKAKGYTASDFTEVSVDSNISRTKKIF